MVCPCPSRLGRRQLSNGKEGGWFSPKRHSISKGGIKRTEREKKIFYETLAALRGVVNWVGMMPDADAPATIAAKPQAFERGHLTTEAGLRSAAYGRGGGQHPVNGPIIRLQGPTLCCPNCDTQISA